MENISELLAENLRRKQALVTPYDQLSGIGCSGERVKAQSPDGHTVWVPREMLDDEKCLAASDSELDWCRLRIRHDFEYWAARCVKIKDKISGKDVPLLLNRPQRRVTAELERQRRSGEPIRLIMLKARQWGGSTLVLMYMAWLQCCRQRNWHSLICAHVKDTSAAIRGMYAKMLQAYPEELWTEEQPPSFAPYERAINTRLIKGRDCRVTLATSERQESARGSDIALAHLSEVAFWNDTASRSPEGFIRAVCSGIARMPESIIVLESTANGVGNYFHTEWLRSKRGESDKVAIFVPWYEIDIYSSPVADAEKLWKSLTPYERGLWELGCTLEQIKWYHDKRREYPSTALMAAEFPTDDVEAFTNTGRGVFAIEHVERLRQGCRPPVAVGELMCAGLSGYDALCVSGFVNDSCGRLKVWRFPDKTRSRFHDRYIVAVDVGGRSEASDFSVITVIDTCGVNDRPEVVAQWRGHGDHDLLAWRAAGIASWYDEALLVIESNTLETENTDGDHGLYILTELSDVYRNLYHRESRPGFHTNRATKTMVINHLIGMVREAAYTERDSLACDELAVYECDTSGKFAAKQGHHDDILMTRAIALYIASHSDRRCNYTPAPLNTFYMNLLR